MEEEKKVDTTELEAEIKRLKQALSEKNSENASKKREIEDWKAKYESTLSESEKAEQIRAEKEAERDALLKSLMREKDVSGHKANFLSVGYDNDLAQKSAEALVDGRTEDVFNGLKQFIETKTQQITAESLKLQPELSQGETPQKEDIEKAEYERLRHYAGL